MGVKMWIILTVLYAGYVLGDFRLDPLVDTELGLIKGLKANDGDYSMFLGVPYAQVDLENPFGEALPYPKFDDVFEAYDGSAMCPQRGIMACMFDDSDSCQESETTGTLDCLHLNIYVPNKASSRNRMPVMVWIHGGGFEMGSGDSTMSGPKYLVQHDVIFVSLNYRLGPYGFMCLDTPEVPGNQGLKDQYLALDWIKKNIGAFGGDSKKITITGESAGSMSVDYHLLTERPKLFNQAIMQSGTALCPSELVKSDTTTPIKIAEHLGFKTEDMAAALDFLTNTNPNLVIAATSELNLYFKACVEKDFDNVKKFVSENPELVIPRIGNMPILAGFTSQEQLFLYANKPKEFFQNLNTLLFNDGFEFEDVDNIVRRFYLGDDEISESKKGALVDFASDYKFNHPIQRMLIRYLQNGNQNIYHYVFSYKGGRNMGTFNITEIGAAHGDDIGYLLESSYFPADIPEEDQLTIDRMTTLWTNFVKFGNPVPETSELLPVKWEPITKDRISYLNIGSELVMGARPYHSRMAFWDLFYKLYPEKFLYN